MGCFWSSVIQTFSLVDLLQKTCDVEDKRQSLQSHWCGVKVKAAEEDDDDEDDDDDDEDEDEDEDDVTVVGTVCCMRLQSEVCSL